MNQWLIIFVTVVLIFGVLAPILSAIYGNWHVSEREVQARAKDRRHIQYDDLTS